MNLNMNYLTDRTQFVKIIPTCCSDTICSNTVAPQGTVFCYPFYSLLCPIVDVVRRGVADYADGAVITGVINGDDGRAYLCQLQSSLDCYSHFL